MQLGDQEAIFAQKIDETKVNLFELKVHEAGGHDSVHKLSCKGEYLVCAPTAFLKWVPPSIKAVPNKTTRKKIQFSGANK